MEVEKAVILFYLGLAAAFCGAAGLVRGTECKGWLAIAKLKPLSLFISLLSMPKKAFDNVEIEK